MSSKRLFLVFTIGDATATSDACFRCVAYADKECPPPEFRFALVGCVSILAPLFVVYGVRYDFLEGRRRNPEVIFEPLPPEMETPARLVSEKLAASFGVEPLPRSRAEEPIPLIVHGKAPPETTLFHALFTSEPERIP